MPNISNIKEKILLQSKNDYFYSYIIFIIILFLSKFIFAYDEERVIVLCLISFVIIFYENTHKMLYNALNERSTSLEEQFLELYNDKVFIMKKLRIYWRLFLDLEELIIEFYVWIRKQLISLVDLKKKKRIYIVRHFIKDKIKVLLDKKNLTKKTINLIYIKMLSNNFFIKNKNNSLNFLKSLNSLKNINQNINYKHLILNKINLKINFLNKYKYFSYLYLIF